MVRSALDAGVNVVDTADMYGAGESEEIVGRALKGRRDDVILATKVHFPTTEGPNQGGNSRRWITRAVEASLGRLQTDWLDLYQVHRPDETTDIEETLAVMSDLVSAGKVRAFGSSTFPAHDIVEAQHVATRMGRGRFRTEQPPYSLLARGAEAEVFALSQRYGMGVLVWSPLAFGFLTGRYRSSGTWDSATGRPALRPTNFDPGDATTRAKLAVVGPTAGGSHRRRLHTARVGDRVHPVPSRRHVHDHRSADSRPTHRHARRGGPSPRRRRPRPAGRDRGPGQGRVRPAAGPAVGEPARAGSATAAPTPARRGVK